MVALAARRDRMSEPVRWLSVLMVGATGILFAVVYRSLTSALSAQDKWPCAVVTGIVFAWPLWRFVRKPG